MDARFDRMATNAHGTERYCSWLLFAWHAKRARD